MATCSRRSLAKSTAPNRISASSRSGSRSVSKELTHNGLAITLQSRLSSVGILVAGGNHFIVRGPVPSHDEVRALARFWSLIQIGRETPERLRAWRISTHEFREELQWAAVMAIDEALSPAVSVLLDELAARGVAIETVTME